MTNKVVFSPEAPAAAAAYSQAIDAGGFIFCSGQIPLDPATGEMVQGSIKEQTRRCLENLRAVVRAAGLEMSDIVKVTVLLADIGDYDAMNEVYAEFFTEAAPARAAFAVAGLPKGAAVEIECIARR